MSEPKKETKKDDAKATVIVEDSIDWLKSDIIKKDKLIEKLSAELDAALTENVQLKARATSQLKAEIIADIEPRYNVPKEHLILKSLDELKQIKSVLDNGLMTVFKSGTPVVVDKSNPYRKLASKFDVAQARRMEGNK